MKGNLTAAERAQLRQWQKQRRDNDGYVKVTVVLMLDAGWPVATVAETLGLDQTTVYRYTAAFAELGLAQYLGHISFYEPAILLNDPLEVVRIWHGGLASHGATLSIPLACWLFARHHQFDTLWVLDRIVLVVGIGGACIRLGNFMNSEIGGYPTSVPWAVVFPRDTAHLLPATSPLPTGAVPVARPVRLPTGDVSSRLLPADTPTGPASLMAVPRHPTQLYEALYCVLLASLLYYR